MGIEHILYIPLVVGISLAIGFSWGRKTAMAEFLAKQRRMASAASETPSAESSDVES